MGQGAAGAEATTTEDSAGRAVKIPYGGSKSKYALAFRLKLRLDSSLNLATFKLVPKASAERPKWEMQARYITLPAGEGAHAEQVILGRLAEGDYRGIEAGLYWVKWVYSERLPCWGRADNECARLLQELMDAQERSPDAPRLQIFYSFDAEEEAGPSIAAEVARRQEGGAGPVLVSRDKGRDPSEVEERQRFYEAQLEEDIRHASGRREG